MKNDASLTTEGIRLSEDRAHSLSEDLLQIDQHLLDLRSPSQLFANWRCAGLLRLDLKILVGIQQSFRRGYPLNGNSPEPSLLLSNRLPEETRRSHLALPMERRPCEVPPAHRSGRHSLFPERS